MATTTVTAKVIADTSGFMTGLNRAGKSMQKFGQKATTVGRNLSTAISLPLVLIGRAAIKTAASFEFAQKKIEALRGGASIKELTKSARDLGASTIFTAEQVSQLQLSLAKLGKSNKEIQAIQGTVLRFAQAMDQDLAPAGEFLVKTMNRYSESLREVGNETEQAAYVGNLFAAVAANTALDAGKLAAALNYVGSEAAVYGISLGETSAILGLLADRGFDASRGGTALRRILGQLAKEGYSASEAIEALLNGTNGYSDALATFGLRGAGPAASLGGLNEEFETLLNLIEGSDGFLNQFATVLDTSVEASLKRTASAATEVSLAFAEDFKPAINNILSNVTRLLKAFSELPSPIKKFFIVMGTLLAVIGPLALVIGALTAAVGALTASGIALSAVLTGGLSLLLIGLAGSMALVYGEADVATLSIDQLRRAAYELGGETKDLASNQYVSREELAKLIQLEKSVKDIGEAVKRGPGTNPLSVDVSYEFTEIDLKDLEASVKKQRDLLIKALEDRKWAAETLKRLNANGGFSSGNDPGAVGSFLEDDPNKGEVQQRTLNQLLRERLALIGDIARLSADAKTKGGVLDVDTAKKLAAELKTVESTLKLFGVTFDKIAKETAPRWKDLIRDFELINPELAEEVNLRKRTEGLLKGALQQQATANSLRSEEAANQDKISKSTQLQVDKAAALVGYYRSLLGVMGDLADNPARFDMAGVGGAPGVDPASSLGALLTRISSQKATTDEYIGRLTSQMETIRDVSMSIGSVFESIFKTALDGTMSLGQAISTTLGDAIKSLIAKLAGLAIAWGVVALLATIATGGGNLANAAGAIKSGGFTNFAMGGLGLGSFGPKSTGGASVRGVLSGSDVVLTSRRGATALDRIYG